MMDDVEKGNTFRILRHGKPVAELTPLSPESTEMPSWKRPGLKLSAKGISLSKTILEEQELS
jgi:antitoxin (DNA-binding transcriptional repressor) of toxin-antitoxin stability system